MDTIDFQIERLILKNGNMMNSVRDGDLRDNNLTPAQSETILFYFDRGGTSIKDLAEHLKITHQAARKLVEKLKSKGILDVRLSSEDKRRAVIYLSDSGQELCGTLKKSGSYAGERILKDFSPEEKKQLLNYLKRIENNLGEE